MEHTCPLLYSQVSEQRLWNQLHGAESFLEGKAVPVLGHVPRHEDIPHLIKHYAMNTYG